MQLLDDVEIRSFCKRNRAFARSCGNRGD